MNFEQKIFVDQQGQNWHQGLGLKNGGFVDETKFEDWEYEGVFR